MANSSSPFSVLFDMMPTYGRIGWGLSLAKQAFGVRPLSKNSGESWESELGGPCLSGVGSAIFAFKIPPYGQTHQRHSANRHWRPRRSQSLGMVPEGFWHRCAHV